MRVRFFNPSVFWYSGVHYRLNPALGLPVLAAVLKRAGHQAHVWDLEALQITPERLAQQFASQRGQWPDAVGFTCTTHGARGVRECIAALRGVGFDRYIAVGGPHVTALAWANAEIERLRWGADAFVVGECEGNVARLFEKRASGVFAGDPMPIEEIPGPDWAAHTPLPTYYWGNAPRIDMPEGIAMWSRGCPHSCIFCANPVFGQQKVRRRPVAAIYDDMAALKALGVKSVFVYDDELPGTPGGDDWLMEVCEAIRPLGGTWKCQGRCTTKLTKDVLQAMYDAGCRAVMWGVESFSDSVLIDSHKGTTEPDIWHTLRLARSIGIGNWLFLMVGNYQETASDLAHTARQLETAVTESLVQWRQVTITTPMPGTELYRLAEAEGWAVPPPEGGPQMNQVYNATPWLSKREMKYWKARMEAVGL